MLKKKIIEKIGILINWTREVDFYYNFLNKLKRENFKIIINDIDTIELERKNNAKLIKKKLDELNLEYCFYSEIFNRYKFKVLISTGLTHTKKISLFSIIRFFYGKTIGFFFEIIKLDSLFQKFFKRPFTGGGLNSKIYSEYFPEKKIGEKTVFFPRGMDLRLKHFPNNKFKKVFDIFLCHGEIDKNLISNKFKKKDIFIIGYPRYDENFDIVSLRKKIISEFNLNETKKTIFWRPTYIEEKNEVSQNISLWLEKISKLNEDYNLIIRPHPKNLIIDRDLKEKIKTNHFFIDEKADRKLAELYIFSDLILLDYGSSVLSSIYLKKNFAVLELPGNFEYIQRLKKTRAIDFEIRNEIDYKNVIGLNDQLYLKKIESILNNPNLRDINLLKEKYFGKKKSITSLESIAEKFQNFLNN